MGMFYICLLPSIKVSKASKNATIFKFELLHYLLMLLFLLSNDLNATNLNLSNIGSNTGNSYRCVPREFNVLHCFLEQLWITICRIVMSGDVELNPGPKRNSC